MKLVSFNIGIKINNSEEVGNFIKNQNADIVAFQEIARHFDESVFDMYKSQKNIKDIIGGNLPYSFFGPQWIANRIMKDGEVHHDFNGFIEQGNEIYSKYPIVSATNQFYHKRYSLELDHTNFYTEDHPRCVQVVELDVKGKKIQILNLHGLYSRNKRDSERTINQCNYVVEVAKRKQVPTIIVGDFNLFPETQSMKILDKAFRNIVSEFGITSTRPILGNETDKRNNIVDYVFVDDNIHVHDFEVFHTTISDHFPLILDFDIGD